MVPGQCSRYMPAPLLASRPPPSPHNHHRAGGRLGPPAGREGGRRQVENWGDLRGGGATHRPVNLPRGTPPRPSAPAHLPGVPGLAVGADQALHVLSLGDARHPRGHQQPAAHLIAAGEGGREGQRQAGHDGCICAQGFSISSKEGARHPPCSARSTTPPALPPPHPPVAVPVALLFFRQLLEQPLADDVLEAN